MPCPACSSGLASATDAKISCCEVDREYARSARDWWLKAGVSEKMEMSECSAEELMQSLLDKGEVPSMVRRRCDAVTAHKGEVPSMVRRRCDAVTAR